MDTGYYSKIKATCKTKSRSIDYSDLSSLPHQSRKLKPNNNQDSKSSSSQEPNRYQNKISRSWAHAQGVCLAEEQEQCENGGHQHGFVAVLSRNSSVSSSTNFGFQSAVKRAFSMRRSSSVAERYCRIHDQFGTMTSPIDDGDEHEVETEHSKEGSEAKAGEAVKKKNRARKILKACKRLFGI